MITGFKKCNNCGETKPLEDFYFSKSKGKFHNRCRVCDNLKMKEYRDLQTTKVHNEKTKNSNLKRKFNITYKDFIKLSNSQNNACLICKRTSHDLKRTLSVDHDHKTGKIRGLLCNRCNTLIGYLESNKNLLSEAFKYLETHTKT